MTQKFNIGDRVVVSNPANDPNIEYFVGKIGEVERIGVCGIDSLYKLWLEGRVYPTYFYPNELTRIEEES